MSFANPVLLLEAQLSFTTTWTDITADVVSTRGLTATKGKHSSGPQDCVADPGRMTWTMNNSNSNSAHQVGYYSPYKRGHGRTGWQLGIAVRLSLDGNVRWVGFLDSIDATPNLTGGDGLAYCTAVDWMDLASRMRIVHSPTLVSTSTNNITADVVLQSLITGALIQPPGTNSLSTGSDIYPFALDTARTEQSTILSEFQRIAQAELGFLYIGAFGGVQFANRTARLQNQAVTYEFLEGEYQWASLTQNRTNVVTTVRGAAYPRTQSTGTITLFTASSTMKIAAGGSISFTAKYTDPNQKAARVGGTSLVAPVSGTDYIATVSSGGGGASATAFITVSGTSGYGGDSADFTLSNTGTSDAFVTLFQFRGTGLFTYSPVYVYSAAPGTTALNTINDIVIDLPYQSYTSAAQTVVDKVKNTYFQLGGISHAATSGQVQLALSATNPAISFLATTTDLKDRALAINPVTCVSFHEKVNTSATSDAEVLAFYPNGIDYEIQSDGMLKTTLYLFRGWTT